MRAALLIPFTLLLTAAGCSADNQDQQNKNKNVPYGSEKIIKTDYASVLDEVTHGYFRLNPELATYYGVPETTAGPGVTSKLMSYGAEAEKIRRAEFHKLLTHLKSVDLDTMSVRDATMHAALVNQLSTALAPSRHADYGSVFADYGIWFLPYPVTQLSGPQINIPSILEKQHVIQNENDANAYLARMSKYGSAIDGVLKKIAYDKALGVIPPAFIIERTLRVIADKSANEPHKHPLVIDITKKSEAAGLDASKYADQAANLIKDEWYPANDRLSHHLTLLKADATQDAGVWRLPSGDAFYDAMIAHMTDTNLSAREIHEIGLREVERILTDMDAILRSQGMTEGSVGERMKSLLGNNRFLYPNTDEGKAQLIADLNTQMEAIEPLLDNWFGRIPSQKVVVKAVPKYNEASATGGFYDAPALDGSRPGTFWINLRDTAIWPSYTLRTLVYHEASPGHHFETSIGLGLNRPVLASVLYSNAFGEGWALYAEALAKEMGLYADDPFGDLGRLQAELHRAVRLVVDTGIHAKRWSREDAITYMVETEGSHIDDATAEIERYIVWPGQALGYKMGMIKIQEMRKMAEDSLGPQFDIKKFHDLLLADGGLPLQVLEAKIKHWITNNKQIQN